MTKLIQPGICDDARLQYKSIKRCHPHAKWTQIYEFKNRREDLSLGDHEKKRKIQASDQKKTKSK